jgi:Zn-dependent protease
LELLVFLAVLILSLSFHEAAHAWTANRLGDPTARLLGRLTLNPLSHVDVVGTILFPVLASLSGFPLIGWAKPVPVNSANLRSPRRDFAVVAAAGPASNLLLAFGGILLLALVVTEEVTGAWHLAFLRYFVQMNVLLAAFNLLPVPPLDGGNILAGVVPERGAQVLDRIRPYGIIVLYVLVFADVLGLPDVLGAVIGSILRLLARIVP